MVNYENGKIYRIVCNITGEVYVGSTTKKYLSQRLDYHRKHFQDYKEGKMNYVTSFKIIERGNYDIILIECFSCNNRDELLSRERYWIENTQCINKVIPTRTRAEYRRDKLEENPNLYKEQYDKYKETHVKYRELHKEERNNYNRKYKEEHKESIKKATEKYREQNKDKIYEQKKKSNYSITCGCGVSFQRHKRVRHESSKRHIKFMSQQAIKDDNQKEEVN